MREIKFRARNANLPRCWVYGYFVVEDGGNYIINDEGKFKVIAGTEGQYIRRKDENGKEIYEGDKLEHSIDGHKQQSPYIVVSMEQLYTDINLEDSYYRIDEWSLKIIGNIYENPELSKGK